jgi:hypothetical protein
VRRLGSSGGGVRVAMGYFVAHRAVSALGQAA